MELDHQYIRHQKTILQCLRVKVTSLSDDIKHLIRARSVSLQNRQTQREWEQRQKSESKEMQQFGDELISKGTIHEVLNRDQRQQRAPNKKIETIVEDIKEDHPDSESDATTKQVVRDLMMSKTETKMEEDENVDFGMNGDGGNGFMDKMDLSNLEIQEFMKENEDMVKMLEEEEQEVMLAEQKTVGIMDLMDMFTEQVVNQNSTIGGIETSILASLENLEIGNRELEKARERGKDTRTVFMTVVLTLTFSLLFLEWYKS